MKWKWVYNLWKGDINSYISRPTRSLKTTKMLGENTKNNLNAKRAEQ